MAKIERSNLEIEMLKTDNKNERKVIRLNKKIGFKNLEIYGIQCGVRKALLKERNKELEKTLSQLRQKIRQSVRSFIYFSYFRYYFERLTFL